MRDCNQKVEAGNVRQLRAKGVAAAVWLILAAMSAHAERQKLSGHVPPAAVRSKSVGRLGATNRLDLALELPLRNKEALTNLLHELYDPASANYHRYLTSEEFTERFGPTESDYAQLRAFAERNGLQVTTTHPNRLLLDVKGSAADIEKALGVTLRLYQHPIEDRNFYAPDTDPTVDLALPLMGVSGLNNYWLPKPRVQVKRWTDAGRGTWAEPKPNSGSGPSG